MHYSEHRPPPDLADAVECVWLLQADGATDGEPERVLPDGCSELIVNRAEPFEHHRVDGGVGLQPRSLWVGQITQPMFLRATGRVDLVGIRLRPNGGTCLAPVSQAELAGRWFAVDEVHTGLGAALECVEDARIGEQEILSRVFAALRSVRKAQPDPRILEACRIAHAACGRVTVDEVARHAGTSVRTLERLFLEHVGMPPKRFLRIRRFQSVVGGGSRELGLTRCALEAGYYDLAHLFRDFREFAGTTPGEFFGMDEESLGRIFTSLSPTPDDTP